MEQCIVQDLNIGNNLKKLRKRANLTGRSCAQTGVMRGLSVSREIYAQMETGKHHIKVSVSWRWKETFRADFEELFEIGTEL